MRLDRIDLNLFVVMDALYRERSVTKVATLLHLTQPAVSNALGRLRQTFDDQLFVRTPDGMMPTPVSDTVIGDVRRALDLLGKSVGVNAQFDPAKSEKEFHLGMNDLAEALILPPLRKKLKEQAPYVSITNYYVDRKNATEELKSGDLDVLLDAHVVNARELEQTFLGELPYVVTMADEHPLARKRKITIEDYLKSEHLHVSSRRKGRGQVEIGLHSMGQKRSIVMRLHSYLVAERVAQQTDLLWTVPKVLANTTSLKTKTLPFDVEPLQWHLFWAKSTDDDPANRWLRQLISDIVNQVLAKN